MVVLNFVVRGSVLSARDKLPQVTTRSNKFFTLNVELDDVWSEYTVTVFFSNKAKPDAAEDVFPVFLHDGSCIVPHEVLDASDTAAYVWLMGLKDDVRATTNIIPIPLTASGYLEGIAPEEPTPDVYTEILESVRGAYNIANDVRADADAGKFNGKPGPQGPAGSDASVTAANIEAAMGYKPADPTKYLPLTGGKLTGNLEGKYITSTWLRSTDAGHQEAAATKVAVLDAQGWIYYRTPAELMADMGLADGTEVSY